MKSDLCIEIDQDIKSCLPPTESANYWVVVKTEQNNRNIFQIELCHYDEKEGWKPKRNIIFWKKAVYVCGYFDDGCRYEGPQLRYEYSSGWDKTYDDGSIKPEKIYYIAKG